MLSREAVKDPYDVLGVDRSATPEEIKAAFRRLAAKHHPDRNPGDEGAVQRFKELNAAHEILKDPQKRAMFDRFGAAAVGGASGGGGPFGGIDFGELHIDGLFADLLGALGIRVGDRRELQHTVELSFEEAAFGCTKKVSYERLSRCQDCGGTGAAAGSKVETCTTCHGKGRVRMQQAVLPIAVERACPACHGKGTYAATPCQPCRGAGLRTAPHSVEVEIPAGIESGSTRRVAGAGHFSKSGKKAGDLELVVHVRQHPFFRRSGDDVVCALPITFVQACLGDEIEIPTLEGKGTMRIPAGTQPGTTLRVRGKGLPRRLAGGRGDQLVEVQIEVPTELNDKQRELVMQLAGELGESVQPQRRTFVDKLKALFS
ncbi:MAG: J domain-containing protein [Myxococcales bacterium]|nr:J domain-containing protein [Myxococcales bacterium]